MLAHAIPAASGETQELTNKQREDFMQTIETLKNRSDSRKMQLIKAGIAVLTPAANNGNAAMALYEKCYKQVEFTEKEKKDKEWREWREQNKSMMASPEAKQMLCYQIRWALITLKAGMEPEETFDPTTYAPQAIALLTEILKDGKVLSSRDYNFRSSILNGPIGKVYELDACRPKGWPGNIMEPHNIIDKLLLKRYREKGDYVSLRNGWNNLIRLEKLKHDTLQKMAKSDPYERGYSYSDDDDSNSTFLPFKSEHLVWMREVDCYNSGEKLTSSNNMIAIMKATKDSKTLDNYAKMFTTLLEADNKESNIKKAHMGIHPGHGLHIYAELKKDEKEK